MNQTGPFYTEFNNALAKVAHGLLRGVEVLLTEWAQVEIGTKV